MSSNNDKVVAGCSAIFIVALLIFANIWIVMLISGALGHVFKTNFFYISFWGAAVVVLALTVIGSFFKKIS